MNGAIYRCHHFKTGEYAGSAICREAFPTSSSKSVHAEQLLAAGWTITKGFPKATRFVAKLDHETQTHCPAHKPAVGGSLMPDRRQESG